VSGANQRSKSKVSGLFDGKSKGSATVLILGNSSELLGASPKPRGRTKEAEQRCQESLIDRLGCDTMRLCLDLNVLMKRTVFITP
jgi:hypothetical protein